MKCWHCNKELIWGSDAMFDEIGLDVSGIVSFFSCSNKNCECTVEVYLPEDKWD